jgi:hypothetical protein
VADRRIKVAQIKKLFTYQTPVNKGWQGFLFANYKSIVFDFWQK